MVADDHGAAGVVALDGVRGLLADKCGHGLAAHTVVGRLVIGIVGRFGLLSGTGLTVPLSIRLADRVSGGPSLALIGRLGGVAGATGRLLVHRRVGRAGDRAVNLAVFPGSWRDARRILAQRLLAQRRSSAFGAPPLPRT